MTAVPGKILILGGTTEARMLAERLAGRHDLNVTLSLAGRTASPARQPVPVRVGGFGGAAGLVGYLLREQIGVLIDATHPYASVISASAVTAAREVQRPIRRAAAAAMGCRRPRSLDRSEHRQRGGASAG